MSYLEEERLDLMSCVCEGKVLSPPCEAGKRFYHVTSAVLCCYSSLSETSSHLPLKGKDGAEKI